MKQIYSKCFYICICFTLIISIISCSTNDSIDENQEESEILNNSIENEILILVNKHRNDISKSSLKINIFANTLSKEHTQYMINKNTISHDNFNQRSQQLFDLENAKSIGENVAAGQTSATSVMQSWLNSDGHKKNIEGDFTHIGISAIKNESGTYYYTQIFFKK